MYAVMTFQKNVRESRYVFDFRLGILCSKQPIKKIRIYSKSLCPQSPPFSRAKPAKRNERAMGTRMFSRAKPAKRNERAMGTRMFSSLLVDKRRPKGRLGQ